jgi:putative ABC transport system permease protein
MSPGALWALVRMALWRERRGAVFSGFGVAVGVGALVFFVALGVGVGGVVRERVFPVDTALVDVVPPQVSLGALLGGGRLDQATVTRLSELPGVVAAYRRMNVKVPAVSRYEGEFFGSRLRMGLEVLAQGVDPALLSGEVDPAVFAEVPAGEPIPAVAATRLLEIYNKSFAPARKLPQLSPQMLVGFTFPVEFNRSFVTATPSGNTVPTRMQLVGMSDRALLAGVTIPLQTAVRLNRQTGQDAETFTGVTLRADDPARVPRIVEEVKRMGFDVDDTERRMAQSAGAAVAIITSALALLSVLICVLAAVNIAHALSAQVRARAKEIGVMQAVGASRADVRRLVLAEAGVIGFLGGTAGTLLALGGAAAVDALALRYLPPFPFQPQSFFAFPAWLVLGGVALGLLAALCGAYAPSQRAAATDPARTLAG